MPEGGEPEEVMVQWRGIDHGIYRTRAACTQSLDLYGDEHIVNLFMKDLNFDIGIVPFPKMMPKCVEYDTITGMYPDYPQFDIPVDKPDDGRGVKNDGLGRQVSGFSRALR